MYKAWDRALVLLAKVVLPVIIGSAASYSIPLLPSSPLLIVGYRRGRLSIPCHVLLLGFAYHDFGNVTTDHCFFIKGICAWYLGYLIPDECSLVCTVTGKLGLGQTKC